MDSKSRLELKTVARCKEQVRHKMQREERSRDCLQSKGSRYKNDVKNNENYTEPHTKERSSGSKCKSINNACLDMSLQHERNLANSDESLSGNVTDVANYDIIQGLSVAYRLGPSLIKRLHDLLGEVRRTSSVLTNREERQEADEEEDSDRSNKRNIEFDTMFARNHLYEVRRTIEEANRLTAVPADAAELESKSAAGLKCVSRALHVYTNRAAKGVSPDQRQLAPIFQAITAINGMLERLSGQHDFPLRRDVEMASSYLNRVVLEMNPAGLSREPVKTRDVLPKPSSDLSMYNRKSERKKKPVITNRTETESSASKARSVEQTKASENSEVEIRNRSAVECVTSPSSKSQNADKELRIKAMNSSDTKEVSFRNATRAVSEEQVTTMMETIPIESSEECKLSLDDRTFQTLKFLSESCKSLQEKNFILNGQEKRLRSGSDKPDCNESFDVFEKNIQLVCVREDETTYTQSNSKELCKRLFLCEETELSLNQISKTDFQIQEQRSAGFDICCPQNTDGCASTTIEMLAKNILMDMITQHQKGESDKIVEMLYNLDIK